MSADAVDDENHGSVASFVSLTSALTDRQHHTTLPSIFSLKSSRQERHVSASDAEELSLDEVGRCLESAAHWNIDWIAVSFPVRNVHNDPPFPWMETTTNSSDWNHKWATEFALGEGWARLAVKQHGPGRLVGYLEINPSTCLYGQDSPYVAPLEDALYVLDQAMELLPSWVARLGTSEEVKISRLDVTMNVSPVGDVQRVLEAAERHLGARQAVEVYRSAKGTQTVTQRSNRAGNIVIYDKGLQARLGTPVVRFELQNRRGFLRKMGVTLDNLDQNMIGRIVHARLGPMITDLRTVHRTTISDIKASRKEYKVLVEMVGITSLKVLGHHPPVTSHAMNKKYKPLLKKYRAKTVGDLLQEG